MRRTNLMGRSEFYAIQTVGLGRSFGSLRAVEGLDLLVETGTSYGLLGRNGAGKSTTVRMLTGILMPTSGSVRLLNADMASAEEAPAARKRIGVVPDDLALFDLLTGHEHLEFVGRVYGMDPNTAAERTDELFSVLEIAADRKQLVLEYSHGMRRKLALAAALLPDPELLFLDEPFEGVDAVSARTMQDILRDFSSRGSTVFITSHLLDIVERLCTHVGIVDKGRLVAECAINDLGEESLETMFLRCVGPGEGVRRSLSWVQGEPPP